jgi:integrase
MSGRRSSPFLIDAVEEFLRTKAARAPKTRYSYSAILLGSERGTRPTLGIPMSSYFRNRRFNTVTHDEVAAWFAQRVEGGAQATKHRISKGAREFLRFARERGHTTLDLASAIDPYAPGGPRLEWLEWHEIHTLLGAISEERYRMAAAWLFFTGCRVGEACAARQADVRFRREADLYEWRIPDTKTHVPRSVWLPGHLRGFIERSRNQNQSRPDWPVLWDCSGRGFARIEDPAAPITPWTINSVLERAREAVGLTTHITAHVAKHSYCTNWINEYGSDELAMEKLSRQVGTSVDVLRRTYVHITLTPSDWTHLKTMGSQWP